MLKRLICNFLARSRKLLGRAFILSCIRKELPVAGSIDILIIRFLVIGCVKFHIFYSLLLFVL